MYSSQKCLPNSQWQPKSKPSGDIRKSRVNTPQNIGLLHISFMSPVAELHMKSQFPSPPSQKHIVNFNNLLPLPACRARGPPSWSTSSRHLGKVALARAMLSAAEEGKNPQGHLLAHGGGKKKPSSPQLQGTRGHPGGAREPGSNLAQRDKRSCDKWSCSMLQRKAKNPRGPVPMCPGGKFLPDPSAGDRLFPEHGSKTWLLVPQAGHASQEMP